MVEPD
jgi:hypothetical protein